MAGSQLPEEVVQLVREHILSLEQLEILLLLRARAGQEVTPELVRDEVRTSESSAETRLADLARRGFLKVRNATGQTLYSYQPRDAALARAVDLLERAYAERRYTVIDLIFSKPIDNLRVYAGAFRFRKGNDSDG